MQRIIDTQTERAVATMVFADGSRRVVLLIDRQLAHERLASRVLAQAAARARDAAALEAEVDAVAESLGWCVRAEHGAVVSVLTVGVA